MFSLVVVFFDSFACPFRPPFWRHFEWGGRHYTPSGVPLASFRVPLGALLGTYWCHWALIGRPLGFSMELWLGLVFALKCGFLSAWAPPGRHYTASGRSFALARPPLGVPGPPLTPLWVSPGVLWVRSRCYSCVFDRPLDVGPVSVLLGVGRDVRSVHACACFVRVRLVKKDCLKPTL